MVRRFSSESDNVLSRWIKYRRPSKEDEDLVAEVMRCVKCGTRSAPWPEIEDPAERGVIMIQARRELTVRIREPGDQDGELDLLAILDQSIDDPDDPEALGEFWPQEP